MLKRCFRVCLFWFLVRWHCVERGQDSCQLYLKAAFSEICLYGRGETVGATTCCQVRVSDARRAIVFQCKSDMPHGGSGFHPNCFFCGACARAKEVAIYGVFDALQQVVFECA